MQLCFLLCISSRRWSIILLLQSLSTKTKLNPSLKNSTSCRNFLRDTVPLLTTATKQIPWRDASVRVHRKTRIPSSISQLWNLHTLIITRGRFDSRIIAPMKIWKMPQLRHIEFKHYGLEIPNPPSNKDDDDDDDDDDIVVMENLHTLKGVYNLKLNEDVVKRIPNIKKLRLHYEDDYNRMESSKVCCISYLHCLENLYLDTFFSRSCEEYLQNMTSFPHSLKELTLQVSYSCEFDDMLPKIGSLPHLQKLTLKRGGFRRGKWETSEGQFPSLKFLSLNCCLDLEDWTVSESSHFPRLQELRLAGLDSRTLEIPSEIGEIPTLKTIVLDCCSESAVLSAKKIADEQEDLCGDVQVRALVHKEEEALQSLAGPNFQVVVTYF